MWLVIHLPYCCYLSKPLEDAAFHRTTCELTRWFLRVWWNQIHLHLRTGGVYYDRLFLKQYKLFNKLFIYMFYLTSLFLTGPESNIKRHLKQKITDKNVNKMSTKPALREHQEWLSTVFVTLKSWKIQKMNNKIDWPHVKSELRGFDGEDFSDIWVAQMKNSISRTGRVSWFDLLSVKVT